MKKILALAFVLVSATALAADKAAAAKASPDDAVKAAVAGIDTAIAKHDAKAVADLFADDATFVAPMGDGKVIKGKADVQKAHEGMFATDGKDMTTKHTVENIRWIGKDHALVDCSVEMTGMHMDMPAGAPMPTFHATVLLVSKGGKWLVSDARPYSIMPMKPASPSKS